MSCPPSALAIAVNEVLKATVNWKNTGTDPSAHSFWVYVMFGVNDAAGFHVGQFNYAVVSLAGGATLATLISQTMLNFAPGTYDIAVLIVEPGATLPVPPTGSLGSYGTTYAALLCTGVITM